MSLSFFSPAPKPANERERQNAVHACGILRAPPDPALHRIVASAAKLFGAPMAAISIIDRDRMWFAARVGVPAPETSRAISLCAHAIMTPSAPLIIGDASQDERFAGNPFVEDEPGVRFYAGMPLRRPGNYALGTLCVLDTKPRADGLPLAAFAKLAERAAQAIADLDRNPTDMAFPG